MGIGNSKLKKKLNQTVITNINASDFVNTKSDNADLSDPEDYENKKPVLKWHKANPKEGILKIQQEAEIRDIEAIYENSCIREADLFNLMPDHYWTGKENKLPRYFRYQGDYPDRVVKASNLERLKSSSLNDLVNSNIDFKSEDECNSVPKSCRRTEISISCPQIQMILESKIMKLDKTVPKKGILKNRNIGRPNSFTLLDLEKPVTKIENIENNEFFPENLSPEPASILRNKNMNFQTQNVMLQNPSIEYTPSKKNQVISIAEITNIHSKVLSETNIDNNDNSGFSGYFDLSPTRIPDGSSQFLKVNAERKSFIKNNLDKRLNLRPSSMDLANRNILHDQNGFTGQYDFEKTRIVLNEKLSSRPTVTELKKKKIIKFNDFIEVQETDNYDRTINKTWTRLTEYDKEYIRSELNQFKEKEMKIHSRSKRFTKFHDSHDD